MISEKTSLNQERTILTERYQIRRLLGSGGSGDAYLAWDVSLRREVVIKRVRADGKDDSALQRIMEEATKMAALRHPNIVSAFDVDISDGVPCIVMEHIIGKNLQDRVMANGPMEVREFVHLARQSLDALVAAQSVNLIHRDLKPSNIMITELPSGSFQAKLLDFGMAKFVEHAKPSPQTVLIDGSVQGSIHYMSPEQLKGTAVDSRSDLYSLGCALYFAITGKTPFEGETIAEVISSHLTHRVIPPEKLREDLPQSICDWLGCLYALDPDQRFPSAMEAMYALELAAIAHGGMSATTTSIPVASRLHETASLQTQTAILKTTDPKADISNSPPLAMALPERKPRRFPLVAAAAMFGALTAGAAAVGIALLMPPSEDNQRHENFGIGLAAAAETDSLPIDSQISTVPPDATFTSETATVEVAEIVPPVADSVVAEVSAPPLEKVPPLAPEVVFRIIGSNTIGAKLMPALVSAFLKRMGAVDVAEEIPRSEETLVSFSMRGTSGRQAVLIEAHGSSTAFAALKAETCHVGISSRPIKPAEAEQLSFLGDMLSPACEHVVALDGLAVIVNSTNTISSLTVAQLAGIFSGATTDWAQVGGQKGPIHLYARDEKSGTYDSFKSLILGDQALDTKSKRFEDSRALSDAVASDPGGIGFIGLPYVRSSKALAVSDEGTLPMMPSTFTVATEDYVLSRRLFFYTPMVPKHPWAYALVDFALSDEGQAIAEETGVISQRVETEQLAVSKEMPEKYIELAENAEGRLSVSFRFRTGQSKLDAKGIRDVDRVIRFLARPENRNKKTILAGFSDNVGSTSANAKLSVQRAEEVSNQLTQRGVAVGEIIAMGSAMPVASNTSVLGREKNRRVEVWLR